MRDILKKDWYVLSIKNGYESRILRYLEQLRDKLELKKEEIEFKLLIEESAKIKDGEVKIIQKSLLPGYMLVGVVKSSFTHRLKVGIATLPYVIGFVSDKGKATPLREKEVEEILEQNNRTINNLHIDKFSIGEEIIITDGPFTDFVGNVSKVNNDKLVVDVSVFGSVTSIELGILQVEKSKI